MKKLIAGLVMTIMIGAAAQAGVGPTLGGVTVTDIGGGLTQVEGNMTAVRFSKDDVQTIGCRVRGDAGSAPNVVCAARDIDENVYICISFDPSIVDTAQAISPYSFILFQFNEFADCTTLLISVRSHHIPDKKTEKSK